MNGPLAVGDYDHMNEVVGQRVNLFQGVEASSWSRELHGKFVDWGDGNKGGHGAAWVWEA